MRRHSTIVGALTALLVLAMTLAACGRQIAGAPTPAGASNGAIAAATPDIMADRAVVIDGTIEAVRDTAIVVRRADGSSVTVTLTEAGEIRQLAAASAADLTPGAAVTAHVVEREGAQTPLLIQIGSGPAGMAVMMGAGGAAPGAVPGAAPQRLPLGGDAPLSAAAPEPISGTIQAATAGTLTLERPGEAPLTLTLTPETRFQRDEVADRQALQVGRTVIIEGERDGNVFLARTMRILGPV